MAKSRLVQGYLADRMMSVLEPGQFGLRIHILNCPSVAEGLNVETWQQRQGGVDRARQAQSVVIWVGVWSPGRGSMLRTGWGVPWGCPSGLWAIFPEARWIPGPLGFSAQQHLTLPLGEPSFPREAAAQGGSAGCLC